MSTREQRRAANQEYYAQHRDAILARRREQRAQECQRRDSPAETLTGVSSLNERVTREQDRYAQNRETINARRRERYAKRQRQTVPNIVPQNERPQPPCLASRVNSGRQLRREARARHQVAARGQVIFDSRVGAPSTVAPRLIPDNHPPDSHLFDEDCLIEGALNALNENPHDLPPEEVSTTHLCEPMPHVQPQSSIYDEEWLIHCAITEGFDDHVVGDLYDGDEEYPNDGGGEFDTFVEGTLELSSANVEVEVATNVEVEVGTIGPATPLQRTPKMIAVNRQRAHYIRRLPRARRQLDPHMARHRLGPMNVACRSCGGLHWIEECKKGTESTPVFSMCCADGKVSLPSFCAPPEPLRSYFTRQDQVGKHFRNYIRGYNNALAFTSIGVKIDERGTNQGPYSFRIEGALYHLAGSLLPLEGDGPKFAQLYVFDTANEMDNRLNRMPHLDPSILSTLQAMLHEHNPYVTVFKNVGARIEDNNLPEVSLRIMADRDTDPRRYNTPTADEIGMIMVGDEDIETGPRDIILRQIDGILRRISEWHRSYAPLHYVLLFPYGQDGWSYDIPLVGHEMRDGVIERVNPLARAGRNGSKKVTQLQYFAYYLHPRMADDWIFYGGRLLKQYIVDAYACIDQTRLTYIRNNQKKLRTDLYSGLQDAIRARDAQASMLGKTFILPSTYGGSQRNMAQAYQDAMAVVRVYGPPDLFTTFTCNSEWPEIRVECFPGQRPTDRDDVIARVFKLKLKALMADIKAGVLGRPIATMYVIEFQKRGLPHAHILIILAEEHKIRTPEEVDELVSAEIPDKTKYPALYETISKCMAHGPCGPNFPNSPCMVDGNCTKGYPRPFSDETVFGDGYHLYRRRDDGKSFGRSQQDGFRFDNRWIVPHSPYLSMRYNAHVNVEICCSIKVIKYLYKYVYKGHDRASMEVGQERDEIKTHLDARYVSAAEGMWRIYQFKMAESSTSVQRLQVHCEGEQTIMFHEYQEVIDVVEGESMRDTTLTGWFKANIANESARHLTYTNFPQHFTWSTSTRRWGPRQVGFCIGRMYFVSPFVGERYYLRALLIVVRGATCFADLRTYEGVVYPTFQAATMARGLYEDDNDWFRCLQEAAQMQTGSQLRHLFITILLFGGPTKPLDLWMTHADHLSDDCLGLLRSMGILDPLEDQQRSYALHLINCSLQATGKTLSDFGLPIPATQFLMDPANNNRLIREEMSYSNEELLGQLAETEPSLNNGQRAAYTTILEAVRGRRATTLIFFIDGPGGTGKTFLENALLRRVRADGNVALAVASSGIAGLLLDGGRTAHSRFKLPLNPEADSLCNVKKQSDLGELLRKATLILWDEALMVHRHAVEALDRTLQDIRDDSRPFGGLVVAFAGDFWQVLPVKARASRAQIVGSCLKKSCIWNNVQTLKLVENM